MTGLVLLPIECQQFMIWADVWPAFTIGQYYHEVIDMTLIEAIDHVQHRAREN